MRGLSNENTARLFASSSDFYDPASTPPPPFPPPNQKVWPTWIVGFDKTRLTNCNFLRTLIKYTLSNCANSVHLLVRTERRICGRRVFNFGTLSLVSICWGGSLCRGGRNNRKRQTSSEATMCASCTMNKRTFYAAKLTFIEQLCRMYKLKSPNTMEAHRRLQAGGT